MTPPIPVGENQEFRPTTDRAALPRAGRNRSAIVLFAGFLVLYLATSYAGIRSPDSETVFEVCDSLRARGSFAIDDPPGQRYFGVARGLDGQLYSIFGPLESVACVPFLIAADAANRTGWYEDLDYLPPSHFLADGLEAHLLDRRLDGNRVEHARRSLTAWWMGATLGALGVLIFFRIATTLALRPGPAPLLASAVFGAGTLWWPYSGTFFSEPLATVLVLASLELLLRGRAAPGAAGIVLGLATLTHLTSILFVPFFGLLVPGLERRPWRWIGLLRFSVGLAGPLILLGLYNVVRFGDPLETGRGIGLAYAQWRLPLQGMRDLIASPGKGLLFYSPIVLLGVATWPILRRTRPRLALAIAMAAVGRWVFIGARSDWHGGFALGPRYLVPLLPLLLLPLVSWLDAEEEGARKKRRLAIALAMACLATMQQAAFVIGEIFSFLHAIRIHSEQAGVDVFALDRLYTEWIYSPLWNLQLLAGRQGPFLLRGLDLSNRSLWVLFAALAFAAWGIAASRLLRSPDREVGARSNSTQGAAGDRGS